MSSQPDRGDVALTWYGAITAFQIAFYFATLDALSFSSDPGGGTDPVFWAFAAIAALAAIAAIVMGSRALRTVFHPDALTVSWWPIALWGALATIVGCVVLSALLTVHASATWGAKAIAPRSELDLIAASYPFWWLPLLAGSIALLAVSISVGARKARETSANSGRVLVWTFAVICLAAPLTSVTLLLSGGPR